ncbi:MAG: Ig-like domain-containing protein, partial [Planctomycetes bacterium]|nr:Ig-like domain-containing protein [Planctomycetota bacterium]
LSADAGRRLWIEGRGFGADHTMLTVTLGDKTLRTFADGFNTGRVLVQVPSDAASGPLVISRERNGETLVSNDIALLITGRSPQVLSMSPGDGSRGVPRNATVVVEMSEPLDLTTIVAADGSLLIGPSGLPVLRVVRLDDEGGAPINMSGTWQSDSFGRRFEFTRPIDNVTGMRRELFEPESNNNFEVVVSSSVKDLWGNPVVGALTTFGNAGNNQLGSTVTAGTSALSLGFRGRFVTDDQRGPRIQKALYRDVNGNGPSAGDEIEVEFDEDLLYNSNVTGMMDLLLGISFTNGNAGATLLGRPGSNPQRVILTLGANTQLNFGENGTRLNALSSSQPNSIAHFTDYSGQRPTNSANGVLLRPDPDFDNLEAPRMLFALYSDTNAPAGPSAGDRIVLYFNEAVQLGAAATVASLLSVQNGSLSDAMIQARTAGDDYRQVVITLGAASVLTPNTTIITLLDAANGRVAADTIFDFSSNLAHAGSASSATVSDLSPNTPTISSLIKPLHIDVEGTTAGLSAGDVIVIAFDAPVLVNRNAGAASPSERFKLGVAGDRFGFGARIAQPAYVTPRGQGPRLIAANEIVIILGQQPVLTFQGEFGVDVSE